MIGIYLLAFGIFGAATEFWYLPWLTKHLLVLDTWFGKGLFFIFWGFLMLDGSPGWMIFSLAFVCSGCGFVGCSFCVDGEMNHLCNKRYKAPVTSREATMTAGAPPPHPGAPAAF
mmetsp:Transcript_3158/g.9983  ORF Transcript_3158/g.9983 Transcript_3158/m.9983 type:complete len:115 (-) Transcript_3158:192-536(-)